jgi:hypothetical protein
MKNKKERRRMVLIVLLLFTLIFHTQSNPISKILLVDRDMKSTQSRHSFAFRSHFEIPSAREPAQRLFTGGEKTPNRLLFA